MRANGPLREYTNYLGDDEEVGGRKNHTENELVTLEDDKKIEDETHQTENELVTLEMMRRLRTKEPH